MTLLRQILLAAALLGALALYVVVTNYRIAAAEQRASAATDRAVDLQGQLDQKVASDRIVTVFVDRWHTVLQAGATITREIPVYVTPKADAACAVPAGFVRLHDAAAAATVPTGPGPADASPSGLALSTVAGTIVDNYTTCNATSAQLIALQDWVRANRVAKP